MDWSKNECQVLQLVNRDGTHKASIAVSVAQVRLAEDAIRNGTVVETVSRVIDSASFLAKEGLNECICHVQSDRPVDRDWLLETLCVSHDLVQLSSVSNGLTRWLALGWWLWPPGWFIRGSRTCVCRLHRQCLARMISISLNGCSL